MRFVWLLFLGLIAAIALVPAWLARPGSPRATPAPASVALVRTVALRNSPTTSQADSVVAFGLAQRGTPYVYAGASPLTGFDCSGFIMYTFAHVGVAVPHSTALLIAVGQHVARAEAQPGDIVVFTGTAETSTTPGHAGIVISRRGEVPLRFVHASSSRREPFVKVNQVEGSDYERRFMQVRRVLGPGLAPTARIKPTPASRSATAVAAVPTLRARRVVVAAAAPAVAPLPKTLPTRKLRHRTARKPMAVRPAAVVPKKGVVKKKAPATKAKATKKTAR